MSVETKNWVQINDFESKKEVSDPENLIFEEKISNFRIEIK